MDGGFVRLRHARLRQLVQHLCFVAEGFVQRVLAQGVDVDMAHQVGAVHQLLRAAFVQHHAVGGERRPCRGFLVTGAQAVLGDGMVARVPRAGLGKVGEVGIDAGDVRLVLQVVALDLRVDAAHRFLVFQRGAVISSLLA